MSRDPLDNIHWVGTYRLSSEDSVFLPFLFKLVINRWIFCAQLSCFFDISRSLAEFSRIPVVVTNQVRSQSLDEASQYSFQGIITWFYCGNFCPKLLTHVLYFFSVQSRCNTKENSTRFDSHLVAALGIHWAHSVTIRLVLEAKSGWFGSWHFPWHKMFLN